MPSTYLNHHLGAHDNENEEYKHADKSHQRKLWAIVPISALASATSLAPNWDTVVIVLRPPP